MASRAQIVGCGALVAIVALLGARFVRAQATGMAEPVRVRFDAPAGCADGERFLEEVRTRTSRVRAAAYGEPARTFRVTVTLTGERSVGKLVVEDSEHATTPRAVTGKTCDEVVTALALIAALAIDPQASTAPMASVAAPLSPSPSSEPEPAPEPAAVPSSSAAAAPSPLPPRPVAPPDTPAPAAPAPAPEAPRTLRFAGGGTFDLAFAAAPGAALGASAYAEISRDVDTLFAPSLRAAFARHGGGDVTGTQGSAHFVWTLGRIEACPLRIAIASQLSAKPCLLGEVGGLSASGTGPPDAHGSVRPWVAVGALGRIEWRFFGRLTLEAYGGLKAPITREDFVFGPDVALYRAPAVMLMGGAGAGVLFP